MFGAAVSKAFSTLSTTPLSEMPFRLSAALVALRLGIGLHGANSEVIHYPPKASNINDITFALQGSGAPGIFNSSSVPDTDYGIYNWCNMPHARSREYVYVHYASISGGEINTNMGLQDPTKEIYA
jgi:hypothetical protein